MDLSPQMFYTLIMSRSKNITCDRQLLCCSSKYLQTSTFSPPRSERTLFGKPYTSTPFLKAENMVVASLLLENLKKNNQPQVTICATMNYKPPSYKFMTSIYVPNRIWSLYIVNFLSISRLKMVLYIGTKLINGGTKT